MLYKATVSYLDESMTFTLDDFGHGSEYARKMSFSKAKKLNVIKMPNRIEPETLFEYQQYCESSGVICTLEVIPETSTSPTDY